ncbi:outer membrane protein assembly factor BamB [Roseimicrobium gellanilyticum]|uniref:Outer membrane protein assembly factor BamB n=1 Tax=Roseimicrobium gellanilyticum TaxID=748857 RepID=A0A366HQB8_9BACT|nr:PQQ-binding-like beta-propeller repeat protein [Roseimicrobium gellanilyticum]RBP45865.1 outer membrane protein assembly factor BamB [Roseimicrobium gellanilyticum]
MTSDATPNPASVPSAPQAHYKPLRVWPALILVVVIVLCRYVPPFIEGASSQYWYVPVFFPLLGSVLILIWWLAASRARWFERLIGLFGFLVAGAVIVLLSHPSMRGMISTYLTVPLGMVGLGVGALLYRSRPPKQRVTGVLACSALAMSLTLLLQSLGITGDYVFDFHSRWSSAPGAGSWVENKADAPKTPGAAAAIDAALATAEWPGFRGADRMGHAKAAKLATDWKANPPKLLWKKPVGAGWSSFAVAGPYAFADEQRGPHEVVACYDLATGNEVWTHQREARFDEPMGGPGPRATPTLADGAVFTASATGVLQRLKAGTGEVVWQQDFKKLSGREPLPMWGYSASPLVVNSLVIVYAGGAGDKGVMAFDAATGEARWSVACGPESYSSPQLSKVLGEDTLLMLTNDGLLLLDPTTGKVRLNYEWKFNGYRALQPTVVGEDVILLPTPMSEGTRAIRVSKKDDQLTAEELWTSRHLKTDFAELIAHKGHLYGIDGSMFSCIDLETGKRTWKDGRYGKGQAVLLETTDQILIAAEDGRVVLLQADPTAHKELTSFQALKGKTWNHPVVVGDKLLVRNGTEAACYALPLAP